MEPLLRSRHDAREKTLGAVLWSFVEEPGSPRWEGGLVDLSPSGMGIRTQTCFQPGDRLRVNIGNSGTSDRVVEVRWVREVAPALYRSGLRFTSAFRTPLS